MQRTEWTESQLVKLIADVEKEFTSHLVKAEEGTPEATELLAKSEEEKPSEHEKKEEPKAEKEHEAKPAEEKKPEEAPAHEAAGHDYDAEDMEHMKKMYMSMSKAERKAHHDCIMGIEKCGDIEPSAPHDAEGKEAPASHSHPDVQKAEHSDGLIKPNEPKGSPGAQSPASKGQKNLNDLEKSDHSRESGGKIEASAGPKGSPGAKSPASKDQKNLSDMEKSEGSAEVELLKAELETVKAENETIKKNFDGVAAFLTKLVEKKVAPAAKAITSIEAIAKSESPEEEKTLTKSEIDSKLLEKAQDPSLKKSDRDAINDYYLSDKDIKRISHLLK